MTNKLTRTILIVFAVAVLVYFVGQYALNRFFNVMLLTKLVPFIQEQEGGLSRDPDDNASAYPAPWTYKGASGWHTNKGITYQTFVSSAAKLGYQPTADLFFTMPDWLWLKILKGTFMAPWPLDQIAHLPRIQAVIITWAWGSGNGGAETRLARFQRDEFGIQDSNITKAEIVANFKKYVNPANEKQWFDKLCERRAIDFSKMEDYSKYKNGWLSRLNKFKTLFS